MLSVLLVYLCGYRFLSTSMRKFFKVILFIFLGLILLLGGISFYLQTSAGQAFLTNKVVSYLKTKIDKPFSIQKITYKIPDWIELEGVYFSDNKGDTLLAGKKNVHQYGYAWFAQ